MSKVVAEKVAADSRAGTDSSGRRLTVFLVVAAIMAVSSVAFGLFTAIFGIVSEAQRVHAVHNAVVSSLLLVLSAPAAIAAIRAPDRPGRPLMHLTALAIAGVATMAISLTLDPFTAPFVALVVVLWVFRSGQERPFPAGRASPMLLTLVLVVAGPLLGYALGQAELQRIDGTTEHAQLFHWVETSFYAVAVLLSAFLAAVRPSAFGLSAWCAGLALGILGAASLLFPGHASALDAPWAWATLGWSLIFVVVHRMEREA